VIEPAWILPADFPDDLTGWEGFVYCITDTQTGKAYIGKRNFWMRRGKRILPSNWQRYWGSSVELRIDLKVFGYERFERRILSLHRTAFVLGYEEVAAQIRADVLRAKLPDGSPAYYNRSVNGRWFARQFPEWAPAQA